MADTKYSLEVAQRIIALLQEGNYISTACADAGISYKTFRNWIKRGSGPEAREPYKTFRLVCERAQARAETILVGVIQNAAVRGDWKAAHTLLTHHSRTRERWRPAPNRIEAKVESDVRDALLVEAENLLKAATTPPPPPPTEPPKEHPDAPDPAGP